MEKQENGISIYQDNPAHPMSPPRATSQGSGGRPKRPPPITPKRFNRFFTPRSSSGHSPRSSHARRKLLDITKTAINRNWAKHNSSDGQVLEPRTPESTVQKRKLESSRPSSPFVSSSPCKRPRIDRLPDTDIPSSPPLPAILEDDALCGPDSPPFYIDAPEAAPPKPLRLLNGSRTTLRVLQRSFGGYDTLGRGWRSDYCGGTQWKTSDFCSSHKDVYKFQQPCMPFCIASCRTNSLVAIGTEPGIIFIIDSAKGAKFKKTHLKCSQHKNALMDLEFSSDDSTLATAAGDQTARLVDMPTQKTKAVLENRHGSLKQVRFQPGDDSVIATSSREGSVNIWDIRCSASDRPVLDISIAGDPQDQVVADATPSTHNAKYYDVPTCTIEMAHAKRRGTVEEPANSREFYSVTSLSFISAERNHLLATAADGYTSVRLWDIRSRCSRRPSRYYTPLTSTKLPELQRKRDYGITSLTVSGDASRLYALCRDSTVYAYSTQHLILGHAPALDLGATNKSRFGHDKEGLGPIYGLRHRALQVQSFYVKAAVRPARADRPELLAFGSSDSCAILMPTDERDFAAARPGRGSGAGGGVEEGDREAAGGPDRIPIYQVGTALTNGHRREVTGMAWTHGGDLVTLSDDFSARCWREDGALARCVRQKRLDGYEQRCGRAEVEEGFDDDDD